MSHYKIPLVSLSKANAMNREGISALLGPTNTGKTYIAMQRMLACNTGIMGFPLRLLARENYDKAVGIKGVNAVALVTGEEKIIPKQARYFICTVEAMPLDLEVDFVGIDEIQLCGDPERGHIFTDRLLHCRGRLETVFLGAETIRNLLSRLIPDIEIETRSRFSQLTYVTPKRLSRVPRRSAIVVFSAAEVYRVAEELRQHRGGCAVVLGALSPRTRNAQVEMYQAGEVDYMVATDAIGMGLNMDLDHVTFAKTRKFDGRKPRNLSVSEVAQIAGRAGRHMNDGTFTTTAEIGGFDELTVEAVENHRFNPLQSLYWRSRKLDFAHTGALVRSLDQRPPNDTLVKARDAEDLVALRQLLANDDIRAITKGPAAVRRLWDVAGVPDFRKTMTDIHVNMLASVFKFLMKGTGKIPEDYVEAQISRLDDVKGEIDTLLNRIASIRTWTFISHRAEWVTNAKYWQDKTKKIDDRLSDALHDRLTQRFVDRRAAILVRSLVNGEKLSGKVEKDGNVVIEGQNVGTFKGFTFTPDPSILDAHAKPILTAARKTLVDEVEKRLTMLLADNDGAFRLLEDGQILWREVALAKLAKGGDVLEPGISVIASDLLEPQARDKIQERMATWLKAHLKNRLAPYFQLQNADLKGTPRGLAYQLIESLGLLRRDDVADMIKALTKDERKALYDQNVRIGRYAIWVKGLTNPAHWPWRALLWGLWHDVAQARELLPANDAMVVEMPNGGWGAVSADFYAMLGFVPVDLYNPRGKPHRAYVRVDALDHVSNALWTASDTGAFELPKGLAERLSCTDTMLRRIVNALGFKRANERDIERANERLAQRNKREADQRAKRDEARAASEAARKAELLAKEIVAADGLDLTPDQVLAAAEAEAEATKLTAVVVSTDESDTPKAEEGETEAKEAKEAKEAGESVAADTPVDSTDVDVNAPTAASTDAESGVPADITDADADPKPDMGAGESVEAGAETSLESKEDPKEETKEETKERAEAKSDPVAEKELWVRVFRKPGQTVPEGTARAPRRDTNQGGAKSGKPTGTREQAGEGGGHKPRQERSGKGDGKSGDRASGPRRGSGRPGGGNGPRQDRGGKSANWSSSNDKIDQNNPFAALAALKNKKK